MESKEETLRISQDELEVTQDKLEAIQYKLEMTQDRSSNRKRRIEELEGLIRSIPHAQELIEDEEENGFLLSSSSDDEEDEEDAGEIQKLKNKIESMKPRIKVFKALEKSIHKALEICDDMSDLESSDDEEEDEDKLYTLLPLDPSNKKITDYFNVNTKN